jgi:hypothetical protein
MDVPSLFVGFVAGVVVLAFAMILIDRWLSGPGEHPHAVSRQRSHLAGDIAKSSDSYRSSTPTLTRLLDEQRRNPRGGNS